jgi:hypothetical protein
MRIVAYAYEADFHCPACAVEAAAVGLLKREPGLDSGTDEHGLAADLIDREGNRIHPVFDFDIDEHEHDETCGDCRAPIRD